MADQAKHPHLNGAYYGPSVPPPMSYHSHRRGSGCGCGCCLLSCLFKIIFTIVVTIGVAVLVLWLIFRPSKVKFHVVDASLTEFNLTNNVLRYNLALNMTIRNPNKRVGIHYDSIEARAYYDDQMFDTAPLTPFYQGHKTTNLLNPVFRGEKPIGQGSSEVSNFNNDKNAGVFDIDVKLYLRVRFKIGAFRTGRFKPKMVCELKVPLASNRNSVGAEIEKRRTQGDPLSNGTKQKRLIFDDKDGHLSSQKPVPLRGEALGVLLEQKLKELTFQDGDEMAPRDALPEKSTVSILQELLFALTAARDTSQEDRDNLAVGFHRKKYHGTADPSGQESIDDHALNTKRNFKAEEKASVVSPGFPLIGDSDHYSPGSVLEASFSNDSCHSRSFDDNAGHGWHPESMDCSFNQSLSSDHDSACVDSAASLRGTRSDLGTVLNNISVNLYGTDLDKIGLTGLILNHAGRVIMNAELLFGNATLDHADTREDFLAGLLDKLDTHVNTLQRCPNGLLGFMEAKDGFWLRRFLFDCMIEFLDSEYGRCIASGFKPRTKVPLHENSELLMTEVYQEIRRWTNLAGKTPDEIIEWEMSHSLGKWTDFEIEVHETGAEIEGEIFWVLIDETLIDLCECWLI